MGPKQERPEQNRTISLPLSKSSQTVESGAIRNAAYFNVHVGAIQIFSQLITGALDGKQMEETLSLNGTDQFRLYEELMDCSGNEDISKTLKPDEHTDYTQSAREVLKYADEYAKIQGATEIEPSHLLVGIIRHIELTRQRHLDKNRIIIPKIDMSNERK